MLLFNGLLSKWHGGLTVIEPVYKLRSQDFFVAWKITKKIKRLLKRVKI